MVQHVFPLDSRPLTPGSANQLASRASRQVTRERCILISRRAIGRGIVVACSPRLEEQAEPIHSRPSPGSSTSMVRAPGAPKEWSGPGGRHLPALARRAAGSARATKAACAWAASSRKQRHRGAPGRYDDRDHRRTHYTLRSLRRKGRQSSANANWDGPEQRPTRNKQRAPWRGSTKGLTTQGQFKGGLRK